MIRPFSKFTISIGVVLIWLCSLNFVCAQPKTITILHTNDMHAAVLPHEAGWARTQPKPMVGGFKELWWMIDSIRTAKQDVIVLDAGDVMTGTPISEIEYRGAIGGAIFDLMNAIGYDAWTIGNHDLDISQENLKKLTEIVKFPTLSANLTDTAGSFPFSNKEYVVLKKHGVRIGIIGLMSSDLFQLTNRNNLIGLRVTSPIEVAQKNIDEIDPETDIIVALTHEGVDDDSVLAATTHGLDVIVGGHSHTRLKQPKVVNGVIIVQTGANCENLGELELQVDNDRVVAHSGKLLTLWSRSNRPDNAVSKLIDSLQAEIAKEYGVVLGTLANDWKRSRTGESNIGQFVVDAIREAADADVSISNSSSIRKDLPAGKITKLDLFEICPFRNYLCTFMLTGRDLRTIAQRYVESVADGITSIDISGIRCTWKRGGGKPVITSLMIGDGEVVDEKPYVCVTTDFVLSQGNKYLAVTPASTTCSTITINQALIARTQREKTVQGVVENRFQEIQ